MSKNLPKKLVDITGVELTPGEPAVCLGNGEQGFECCCDECDYFLFCFPEFDKKTKRKILLRIKLVFEIVEKGRGILIILRPFSIVRECILLHFKNCHLEYVFLEFAAFFP